MLAEDLKPPEPDPELAAIRLIKQPGWGPTEHKEPCEHLVMKIVFKGCQPIIECSNVLCHARWDITHPDVQAPEPERNLKSSSEIPGDSRWGIERE